MRKTLRIFAAIILVLALMLNIYIIYCEETQGKDFLNDLPYALIPVTGSSMEPSISAGDAIFVSQVPFHTIEIGDVVVFARDGELITHMVMDRSREALLTKGTNNESNDYPVSATEYKAKVVLVIPLIGSLWRISASPISFVIFALLIVLLIFGKDIFGYIFSKFE